MAGHHRSQLRARTVGSMNECSEDRMLIGQRRGAIAEELQQVAGAVKRMRDQAAGDRGTYRMQLIFERSRHTEVSSSTANGPEQIGFFILACPQYLAFGGDELDGQKIVEGEAILAHQPAQAAAEGEPGDAGARNHPARDRQTVQLRLAIELGPGDATLRPCRAALWDRREFPSSATGRSSTRHRWSRALPRCGHHREPPLRGPACA